MDTYKYLRVVFRDGKEHRHEVTMTSAELIHATGRDNQLSFLGLINKWNRQGLLGLPSGGPIYVYVAL